VVAVAVATAATNHPVALLLAPTLVNGALLLAFGLSLVRGTPTIEQIARIQAGWLSPAEVAYCRTVTKVWCAFFFANGLVPLVLALRGSLAAWTWYTGVVGYVLMGVLFGVELTVRSWRFRRYLGAPTDPIFRWIFPPTSAEPEGMRPEFRVARSEESSRAFELDVPQDLACWPGHFPTFQLVPGVLQLDWAVKRVEEWVGVPVDVARVEGLKFVNPLLPGDSVRLCLERRGPTSFQFEIGSKDRVNSLGRIHLAPAGGAS
jgi:hypothetical protein